MNRSRSTNRSLVTLAIMSACGLGVCGAASDLTGRSYTDLCGLQAVRVTVLDLAQLEPRSGRSAGELVAAVSSYLREHNIPIAPPDASGAPVLSFQISSVSLETQHVVVTMARFQEPCSVSRLPGKVLNVCDTWQFDPHITILPRGEQVQLADELRAVAHAFVLAYERRQYVCPGK